MTLNVKINNLPEYTSQYKYFVCREVDDELWFFGAWRANQKEAAARQAAEIDGIVVTAE